MVISLGTHEETQVLKNLKNKHSGQMRKIQKQYYSYHFQTKLGKWKSLHYKTESEEKGLLSAKIDNADITSPKILAEKYS